MQKHRPEDKKIGLFTYQLVRTFAAVKKSSFRQLSGLEHKGNVTLHVKGNFKVIKQMIANCETGNLRRVIRYFCTFHRKRVLRCSRNSVSCNFWFCALAHNAYRTSLLSSLQRSTAITANYHSFGVHWWKSSVNISAFRPLKKVIFSHTQPKSRVLSNKAFP